MVNIIFFLVAFCAKEVSINKDFVAPIRTREFNINVGFNAPFFSQYINNAEYKKRYKMQLDSLKAGGIKWIRPNSAFNWDNINPQEGVFDTRVMDSIVKWTGERGLHIIPFIMYTPEWAVDTVYNFLDAKQKGEYFRRLLPAKMEYWRDFWQFVVERYDGDGYKDFCELKIPIKHYEVWNEPRAKKYFLGSFEDYCNLYIEAQKGALRADTECIVIGPVIEGGNRSTGWAFYKSNKRKIRYSFKKPFINIHRTANWIDYIFYFLSYVKEKTGKYPPIISAHLYYADETNNPFGRMDTLLFSHIDSLFYYFEQNDIDETDVWITEIGRKIVEPEGEEEKRLEFTEYIISELQDSPYSDRIKMFFFAGFTKTYSYLKKKNFSPTPAFKYIREKITSE
ncbi:hypothetical protein JW879_04320 [candidate division WOR-3 bacterium]|nr:hypothetical protein [candidate division WOR-3 bacterium]